MLSYEYIAFSILRIHMSTPSIFDVVKYTELVVRECADLVENQGKFLRYTDMASRIKENFGIKK